MEKAVSITPIDITNKQFRRSFRGYNEPEVDAFLDLLAREYEGLFRKCKELEETVNQRERDISKYRNLEETLNKSLVVAQKAAEDLHSQAIREAEAILQEARTQASSLFNEAQGKLAQLEEERIYLCRVNKTIKSSIRAYLRGQLETLDGIDDLSNHDRMIAEAAARNNVYQYAKESRITADATQSLDSTESSQE